MSAQDRSAALRRYLYFGVNWTEGDPYDHETWARLDRRSRVSADLYARTTSDVSTFAAAGDRMAVPNDVCAGLMVDPGDAAAVIEGWWFYPVCNRCQEQGGPMAWRHVQGVVLLHVEETGHDDWTLWVFRNIPASYDLRTLDADFYREVLDHPDRRLLNAPRCRDCRHIIRLPKDWDEPEMAGMPDPVAYHGDVCDSCADALLDLARLEDEFGEDDALNRNLRKRP